MTSFNRPAHRTVCRLTLEHLEAREVPAAYFWKPTSGDLSTTAGNWLKGPNAPWDVWTVPPDNDDDLIFRGDVSTADCVIVDAPAPTTEHPYAFRSIKLTPGPSTLPQVEGEPPPPPENWYTGTVALRESFPVGTLQVGCGVIRQEDQQAPTGSAGVLTVKAELLWTGGTLNSNSTPGRIDLAPGATGLAQPYAGAPINETVQLGSELRLCGDETTQTGSTLTLKNGLYNLVGGFFRAMAPSILTLAPVPKVKPPSTPGTPSITLDNVGVTDPTIKVDAESTLMVTTVGRVNNTDLVDVKVSGGGAQVHNQGTVIIEEYTRLIMAKRPAANFAEYIQNRAILFDPPVTRLQAGSEIKFEDNGDPTKGCVNLVEGELLVCSVPNLSDEDQPKAAIKNESANPTAPALYVSPDAEVNFHPFHFYVTLAITGAVTCVGEMNLKADGTTSKNDKITATGLMTFQTGQGLHVAKLNVRWRIASGGPPAADTVWKLLIAGVNGGIVNEPTPDIIPTVTPPDTLTAGRLADPKEYGMTFDKQ